MTSQEQCGFFAIQPMVLQRLREVHFETPLLSAAQKQWAVTSRRSGKANGWWKHPLTGKNHSVLDFWSSVVMVVECGCIYRAHRVKKSPLFGKCDKLPTVNYEVDNSVLETCLQLCCMLSLCHAQGDHRRYSYSFIIENNCRSYRNDVLMASFTVDQASSQEFFFFKAAHLLRPLTLSESLVFSIISLKYQ